ncbi:RNA pseudouridine synthase [uncultured Massilia sp.]|uniref:RNA pseudouridine synthase n=1 Tax=uncultured Massilia sp. TaxID=169973 RepID=UPI0026001C4C|nr:RNA pseudouridine synthase [uncultured Massilia sp.]
MTDDTMRPADGEGVRLAKRVADVVPCSRAEAERYIAGGWVEVDGVAVEDPATRVAPGQAVTLQAGAQAVEPLPVTILLHKPAGVDAAGALALLAPAAQEGTQRFLKRHLAKLVPAMPLETAASGLLVFSQDWRVLRKLVEDGARIEHEYVVEVGGHVSNEALERLNAPAGRAAPPKVSRQSEARLRIAGKAIRPGQVEAMCAAAGLAVVGLRRLRVGKVALAGLPVGRWRYAGEHEKF